VKYLLLILPLLLSACGDIDGSVFGDHVESRLRNQNAKSISALTDNGESLKFALISDSHSNHTDLQRVVDQINRSDLDFAIHLGDSTNTAYGMEFDLFADIIDDLRIPYFVVKGNHDAIGMGDEIFRKLFGADNFAFTFKGVKFLIINNLRENSGTPDYDFLRAEINSTTLPVLIFQHVPQFDREIFNDEKQQLNQDIMNMPQVKAVFYGHLHNFRTDYFNGKLTQMVARSMGENFSTVTIANDIMTVSSCTEGDCVEEVFYAIPSH
jgi:predicted phosphodiesterase